jgi:uncharacterized protein
LAHRIGDSTLNHFETVFSKWVVRHRKWIIFLTVFLVLIAGSGIRFLSYDADIRVYFSKDNPQLQALEALENTFTKRDTVLFALAPDHGDVFTPSTLSAIEVLTEWCWQLPFSSRVESITNFQSTRAADDELIVENLVKNAADLSPAEITAIKAIALSEPALVNAWISPTGHVTGVYVNVIKPGKSMNETAIVAAAARKIAARFRQKHPDIDLYLTSSIMIDNAFTEATKKDMVQLVPIMYLLLIGIIGLSLRSITGTLATVAVLVFSMFTGLGLAGWFDISLSPGSAGAPNIILTLAVADSIHILLTLFFQMGRNQSQHEAVCESIRINLQPVLLTSITTAIGFLSMNFSDVPPYRDLGNIVAMGVMAALFYSVFFLPALMAVLPVKEPTVHKDRLSAMTRLGDMVVRRRNLIFWSMLGLILVISAGIFRIELNDNFIKFFDRRYDFRVATDFVEENLTGFNIIEYRLDAGESGGINDPAYLKTLDAFAQWYRRQPNAVYVNTIADTIKRLNKAMHNDNDADYQIPDSRELAAQILLLYEMALPFGLDFNNRINVDKSASRVVVLFKDASTQFILQMDAKAQKWLATHAPDSMHTNGTGLSIMFSHITKRNIESMLVATFLALLIISVLLMLSLRTFKLGVTCLVPPNLVPAIVGFGLWGLLVGRVGLAVSVMAAMTLGIVVDDTIHFVSKYFRARREHDMSPAQAVRYTFQTVGGALLSTSIILVAGFSVIAFSGFQPNYEMAMMTGATIILALVLDFFFLPTLLMKAEEKWPIARIKPSDRTGVKASSTLIRHQGAPQE